MNIRDLQYLVAAADTEHFGQAAARCNVSQPTLSGQIRKLEDTLQVTLFERSHRSVVLTDIGRDIAEHARLILEQVRHLKYCAQSRQNPLTGELRIGMIPTLCAYLLPHFLEPLHRHYEQLRPVLVEETTTRLLKRLRQHDIDLALVATDHSEDENFVSQPLFAEPLWLAAIASHELAGKEEITREDIKGLTMLVLAEGHCLADRVRDISIVGATPAIGSPDLRATSLDTLLQLVAAGQGVTLVPALAVEQFRMQSNAVCFVPLAMPDAFRHIRLLHRRSSSRVTAINAVGELLLSVVPSAHVRVTRASQLQPVH